MKKNKLLFVCLGNICRSPMAEGIMKFLVEDHRSQEFMIDSAGTAGFHVGNKADARMRATANRYGIDLDSRARQFLVDDFDVFDYIFVMDENNFDDVFRLARNSIDKKKVMLMRDFDDELFQGEDVPDPYYGGADGFDNVYQILNRCCSNLLQKLF